MAVGIALAQPAVMLHYPPDPDSNGRVSQGKQFY
jgi:hypothetical protein